MDGNGQRTPNDGPSACGPEGGWGPGCDCAQPAGAASPLAVLAAGDGAPPEVTLEAARERLGAQRGRRYWRSLEELAGSPGFEDMLHREFPRHASEWAPDGADGFSRRRFLQLSSASLALAGLTACTRQPQEQIVPYVNQPEQLVPGRPVYFASTFTQDGYAQGVIVESHEGRPTKVEGNPAHPANPSGGTDHFAQASVLELYDPDRSAVITYLDQIRTWSAFQAELRPRVRAFAALSGAGLRILTGTVTSPTVAAQMEALLAALPEARWVQYEPAGRHNVFRGARRAFGRPLEVRYDLSRADVIVALDADFLTQGPGAVRNAHEWAERRRGAAGASGRGRPDPTAMPRLYALESMPTNTGSLADHRLALAPSAIARFALALAAELGAAPAGGGVELAGEAARWLPALAADLRARPGRALVVTGDDAPEAVHVLAHAMNQALGAVGGAVLYTEPVAASPSDQIDGIRTLAAELRAGDVDTLVVLGANPVFDAPADLDFADAITKAGLRIHSGLYKDETSQYCQWHIPQAHYLESWGDARAQDGTASIVQPLIEPLYQGRTVSEIVAELARGVEDALEGGSGAAPATLRERVRERWLAELPDERAWRRALHDGVIPGTAYVPLDPGAPGDVAAAAREIAGARAGGAGSGAIEISFRPDPAIGDGSHANNPWLQELPKPVTRLTWDNALLVSPATAAELGVHGIEPELVHRRPLVKVEVGENALELPVWVVPGHADGAATIHFGHGRRKAGQVGDGVGFDVYPLRTTGAMWQAPAAVSRAAGTYPMATTQDHFSMEGRHLVRSGTIAEYAENPAFVAEMVHQGPTASMYPPFAYEGYAWGMAVDLNVCTGCSACVIACQSENNIPVVGKEQVGKGREMHWIRIDRYFEGDDAAGAIALHNQPIMCMHCELAPCEVVCPVAATVHSSEGLNDMVYNRCVGTRYCSNNCPYKVRRFNFLKYTDHTEESLKMQRNPDVTVRARGVMEKCTYCVQRISQARIDAKVAGERGRGDGTITDGDLQTACQQACPTGAIVFGDINDPESAVSRRKAEGLDYTLLDELGTKPRTSYLAKLRNPNPALEAPAARSSHGGH